LVYCRARAEYRRYSLLPPGIFSPGKISVSAVDRVCLALGLVSNGCGQPSHRYSWSCLSVVLGLTVVGLVERSDRGTEQDLAGYSDPFRRLRSGNPTAPLRGLLCLLPITAQV